MKIDIATKDLKSEDVRGKVHVTVGTSFTIYISEYGGQQVDWASTHDQVLQIDEDASQASVKALKEGFSLIRFMSGDTVIESLPIYVTAAIPEPVAELNGSATVVPK